MNRRKFLGRIALTAAAAPALKVLASTTRTGPQLPPDVTAGPYDVVVTAPAPMPEDALAFHPNAFELAMKPLEAPDPKKLVLAHRRQRIVLPDLFTLMSQRGLVDPCPNCGAVNWSVAHVYYHPANAVDLVDLNSRFLQCRACGWITNEAVIHACACEDCRYNYMRAISFRDAPHLPRVAIEGDAPAGGAYVVTTPDTGVIRGREITLYELNRYDLCTDRYIHHVTSVLCARVLCAVRHLVQKRDESGFAGVEEITQQPNGNIVVYAWVPMDWHEKRVAEGRA